ncbi:MAG: hypothetical protein NTY41_08825 [Proteobacteria bacterium]|nr:hypothetical protein [Pseudomonadota bacterium]
MMRMTGFNPGYPAPITPNGFEFVVSNGQITGMERVLGAYTYALRLPGNATFAVANGIVTETLTGTYATEALQYAPDSTNANLYHLAADTVTLANPTTTNAYGQTSAYAFTIANGTVTGAQSVRGYAGNTYTNNLLLSPTARLSANGNTVTETVVQGNVVETLQFVTSGTSGLYALAADARTFVQPGTAATLLSIDPYDRVKVSVDANHNVLQVQQVRLDGSAVTLTPNAYTSFSQTSSGDILETVTYGTRSGYEVFRDGNGDGVYTAIAHGAGTTVDLVGLHAQLSAAIDAVI